MTGLQAKARKKRSGRAANWFRCRPISYEVNKIIAARGGLCPQRRCRARASSGFISVVVLPWKRHLRVPTHEIGSFLGEPLPGFSHFKQLVSLLPGDAPCKRSTLLCVGSVFGCFLQFSSARFKETVIACVIAWSGAELRQWPPARAVGLSLRIFASTIYSEYCRLLSHLSRHYKLNSIGQRHRPAQKIALGLFCAQQAYGNEL